MNRLTDDMMTLGDCKKCCIVQHCTCLDADMSLLL